MSTSLQHIIEGISQEKRSNLDIYIGTDHDCNPLFIERNSYCELIQLVREIKTKVKKTLSDSFVFNKIIRLLTKPPDDKKVIYLEYVIETLNNLETRKAYIKTRIYNLDIDKDKLELGNYSLIRERSGFSLVALEIKNDIEIHLDDLGEHEIVDDHVSIFRNFLLVALGDRRFSQSITNRLTQDSIQYDLNIRSELGTLCTSSGTYTTNTACRRPITLCCDLFKQYHSDLFSLVSKDRSKIESKLYESIMWLGQSLSNQNIDNSFLQIAIALEVLLDRKKEQKGITDYLAKKASVLYSTNLNTRNIRKDIFKKIKKYYAKRSSIVHKGQSNVTLKEYYDFFHIVKTCLYNIIALIQQKNFREIKEIYDYIENEKFSHETKQENRIETINIALHKKAFK